MSLTQTVTAEFTVPPELGSRRLDQVVAELMPEHSRARLQGWIKDGQLLLNGAVCKPKDKVRGGDRIALHAVLEVQDRWEAERIELDIVYEDEDLLVINKPAGLVVHPAAGHMDGTLVNALLHHAPQTGHLPRAGVVHRLDKDTTGLMVVAKSLIAHTSLVAQLQARTMGREYEAVVLGALTGGGTVNAPIGRHPTQRKKMAVVKDGKPAVTHYRLVRRFRAHTHVRCKLETGRTHQIRVHMAHIRHALVGDSTYAGRMRTPAGATEQLQEILRTFQRQALHAQKLELEHPSTGEWMTWEAPLPQDMQDLLAALAQSDAAAAERERGL